VRIVALTGVPGTGKTTIASALPDGITVVDARSVARELDAIEGEDARRGAQIVDESRLAEQAREVLPVDGPTLVEGVLAHHCAPHAVILLRCHPTELGRRLAKRDWDEAKLEENVMAETLDALVPEIVADRAREVDTTDADVAEIANRIAGLFTGKDLNADWNDPLGTADWSDTLLGAD